MALHEVRHKNGDVDIVDAEGQLVLSVRKRRPGTRSRLAEVLKKRDKMRRHMIAVNIEILRRFSFSPCDY